MNKMLMLLCAAAAGCASAPKTAVVDGREVPRLTLEFDGQPYTVKHEGAHPRPGGPSAGLKDAGGSIRGRVCGMLVDFDVTHRGDRVQVVGSVDNRFPAAIDVRDEGGARRFTGNLANLAVDFTVDAQQMMGHVGLRTFAMEAAGDAYQGHWRVPGIIGENTTAGVLGIVLNGKAALWQMPAADQAAVLPALMSCTGLQSRMVGGMVLGVGGEATDRPPESSAVYTHGY